MNAAAKTKLNLDLEYLQATTFNMLGEDEEEEAPA